MCEQEVAKIHSCDAILWTLAKVWTNFYYFYLLIRIIIIIIIDLHNDCIQISIDIYDSVHHKRRNTVLHTHGGERVKWSTYTFANVSINFSPTYMHAVTARSIQRHRVKVHLLEIWTDPCHMHS